MTRITAPLALAGAALLAAGLAGAPAQAQPAGQPLFDRADADGDGVVTRAEWQALRAARFARIDTDGNGVLSQAEASAAAERRAASRAGTLFARTDADGDGAITRAEFEAAGKPWMDRLFSRADANGDGAISRAEAAEMRRARLAD